MGNKGSGSLQSKYEFNSTWAERIAGLIIVGLIVDIVAVFIFQKPFWESTLAIAANVLIVAGVWGELIFEKRAKAASDQIVAAAHTRAAEAQEALIKFRTPRHEFLTPENRQKLVAALRPFAGTIFVVGHDNLDREVWDFLWNLEPLISEAGWIHADFCGNRFRKQGWPSNNRSRSSPDGLTSTETFMTFAMPYG